VAPAAPASLKPESPLPPPNSVGSASGGPTSSVAPEPATDPRQLAIDAARAWKLKDGRTLGEALEALSPPSGNLSPWMADSLPDGTVVVNYFAHGDGAPTVSYQFAVDPAAKTVAAKNAAAEKVLGAKPKAPRASARRPKPKPKPAKPPESLDSLLGGSDADKPAASAPGAPSDSADGSAAAAPAPAPAPPPAAAKPSAKPAANGQKQGLDDLLQN
jgi:hypothetical protein